MRELAYFVTACVNSFPVSEYGNAALTIADCFVDTSSLEKIT